MVILIDVETVCKVLNASLYPVWALLCQIMLPPSSPLVEMASRVYPLLSPDHTPVNMMDEILEHTFRVKQNICFIFAEYAFVSKKCLLN